VAKDDVIERDADESVVSEEQPVEKDKGKGKEPETESISKAELAALRRDRDEARESEKFWADRARNGREPVAESKPEPEDDEPDEKTETLVDDFSTKGIKALVDRGLVTKKAAREMVQKEAAKIARQIVGEAQHRERADNTIMSEFADLKNSESELFKATRIEMQRLANLDPEAAKSPIALYAAASTAKAKLDAKAASAKKAKDEDDPDRYEYAGDEEESIRRLRADSQGATRSRGGNRQAIDEDFLPSQTRTVLAGMFPDKTPEEREKLFRRGQGKR